MGKLKAVEHGIKAFVFKLLSILLKKGQEDFITLDGTKLKKVLFLRPEKLGDMVISFPVFDGLTARYPHIKISILGSPRNEPIIKDDPRFDKIFMYKKNIFYDAMQILAIRRERYDCVVDMICDDSVTALFLSQLTAPGKPRIGAGKLRFREYYDYNYSYNPRCGNTGHILKNTLGVLDAFGIDPTSVCGFSPPYITDQEFEKANDYLKRSSNGCSSVVRIGYNLSAGSPTRIWAEEKSVKLIRSLLNQSDNNNIILFSIPSERQYAKKLKSMYSERVDIIPDGINIREVSAIISKLDLLISPDTALIHIARCFRIPVVGLYSRDMRNFSWWHPYNQLGGGVQSSNEDNIYDITVEQVMLAIQSVMPGCISME